MMAIAMMTTACSHRRRLVAHHCRSLPQRRCSIRYNIPLAELITDFFDAMKSRSKASYSYYEATY